jgi:hypothetical protein
MLHSRQARIRRARPGSSLPQCPALLWLETGPIPRRMSRSWHHVLSSLTTPKRYLAGHSSDLPFSFISRTIEFGRSILLTIHPKPSRYGFFSGLMFLANMGSTLPEHGASRKAKAPARCLTVRRSLLPTSSISRQVMQRITSLPDYGQGPAQCQSRGGSDVLSERPPFPPSRLMGRTTRPGRCLPASGCQLRHRGQWGLMFAWLSLVSRLVHREAPSLLAIRSQLGCHGVPYSPCGCLPIAPDRRRGHLSTRTPQWGSSPFRPNSPVRVSRNSHFWGILGIVVDSPRI